MSKLKTVAGIIIALLVIQIVSCKILAHKENKEIYKRETVQQMNNRMIVFMNAVHSYYKTNNRLPEQLSDLECDWYPECAFGKNGSDFYITCEDEWAAIQPYLESGKVKYHCRSTLTDNFDDRFQHCTELDKDSIPDFN